MSAIRRALISVSDKTGLEDLGQYLASQDVEILSTGGTAKALRDAGITVKDVSDATGFPEIMDGRVKTLHPLIHGGLLGQPGDKGHQKAMKEQGIEPIDLLVVNLCPFEKTAVAGAGFDDCIENIDIGGPALIRAAAKNHESVTVIVDPADYARLMDEMKSGKGATTPEFSNETSPRTASVNEVVPASGVMNRTTGSPPKACCSARFSRSRQLRSYLVGCLFFCCSFRIASSRSGEQKHS